MGMFGAPPVASSSVGMPIPPQVAAAQDYLRFAEQLRNPPPSFDGQSRDSSRDLTPKEQAVYDAALEVLRLYFQGEQDYAGIGGGPAPRDDNGPNNLKLVEVR